MRFNSLNRLLAAAALCLLVGWPLVAQVFLPARRIVPRVTSAIDPPLDVITDTPWAAYSVSRKMWSGWTGPAFIVHNTVTTQHVGFVGNLVDTNSMMTFVGANSGYISLIYDQSGNDRHLDLVPATVTERLRVVNAGAMELDDNGYLRARLRTDVTCFAQSTADLSGNTVFYNFLVFNAYAHANNDILACLSSTESGNIRQVSSGGSKIALYSGSANVLPGTYSLDNQYLVSCMVTNAGDDSIDLDEEGTEATGEAGNNVTGQYALGNQAAAIAAGYYFSESTLFDSAFDDTQKTALEGNIDAFYTLGAAAPPDLDANLAAYWKLDEASGNPRVDSQSSNDLSESTTVSSGAGKVGNAAVFSGSDTHHLAIANNAEIQVGDIDFSVAAWFNMTTTTAQRPICAQFLSAGNQESWIIYYDNAAGRLKMGVSSTGAGAQFVAVTADSAGALSTGTWYFVVGVHDSVNNTLSIQVNGGPVDSIAHSAGVFSSTANLTVGRNLDGTQMDGSVDEVALWKRALTPNDVNALYNDGNGTTCCPF